MSQKRLYPKSPIDLALLEIQVEQREDFTRLDLTQGIARSKNAYPSILEVKAVEAQIGGSPGCGVSAAAYEISHGFALISRNGFDTCQFLVHISAYCSM